MAVVLITQTQLEARLSSNVVAQIYDDNNDGTADTNPITQLLSDASAYVLSWVAPAYGDPASFESSPFASELIRAALDAAVWMAAARHPEYVRRDWEKLKASNRQDMLDLRTQMRSMGESPPDPALTVGGISVSDDPVLFAGGGDF